MIEIIKKKPSKRKVKPHYILKINYMIGDADGYTSEEEKIPVDNPYVEEFCRILGKLKPINGTWGLCLNSETIDKCLKERQMIKKEYDFITPLMFYNEEEEDWDEEMYEMIEPFRNLIKSDTDYSFLVYKGLELTYVDENGQRHKTKITKKPKK